MAKPSYLFSVLLFFLCFDLKVISESNHTLPLNGSSLKLRIGVPMKKGFKEFVAVQGPIPGTKNYSCTGFALEVFSAAVRALPFKVEYEFVPYDLNKNGQSAKTYDDLLRQIDDKAVDGAAGDITIVSNRTSFVNFTLPYSESGWTMLVRVKHSKSMWVVVKPFSWDLWLAIVLLSIFIGFVIRILERDTTNLDFQGSPSRQVGLILFFPMSSTVFPQGEKVINHCSKFVLVVWLCLVFVLMQCYTASLSSMLTVDQLRPTYKSINELRKKDYFVGYQNHSFVGSSLIKKFGFKPSQLKAYSNPRQYYKALSKGSDKGGVDAIFDEIPYIRVFLAKYGSDFMMAGPIYRTGGLAFAFPVNSSLVPYFSGAILSICESKIMDDLEAKYFKHALVSSNQLLAAPHSSSGDSPLTAYNFGGLFIVVGLATLLALFVSEGYLLQIAVKKAKQYSQKHLSISSSKNAQEVVTRDSTPGVDVNMQLPNTNEE